MEKKNRMVVGSKVRATKATTRRVRKLAPTACRRRSYSNLTRFRNTRNMSRTSNSKLMFIRMNIKMVLETGMSAPNRIRRASKKVKRATIRRMQGISTSSRLRRRFSLSGFGSQNKCEDLLFMIRHGAGVWSEDKHNRMPISFKIPQGNKVEYIVKIEGKGHLAQFRFNPQFVLFIFLHAVNVNDLQSFYPCH